jgi:hypothetical protein
LKNGNGSIDPNTRRGGYDGRKDLSMKRKTYNNVMRAIKIIQSKGYGFDEASEIALKCFDNAEQANNGMPIEWWLDKVITADE